MNRHNVRASVLASLVSCLLGTSAAHAADSSEKQFPISTFGTLTLHVPAAWQDLSMVGEPGARVPSMIEFMGRDAAGSVQLKLLPMIPPMLKADSKTDAGLKRLCTSMASRYIADSAEKKLTLVNLDGPEVHGFYYTLTDPSADPGEFKCTSGGAFRIGETVLVMTLMHQPKQPGFDAALDAVKSATLAGAMATTGPTSRAASGPTTRGATKTLSLLAPDGKWRVTLPDPGCGPARGSRRGPQAKYDAYGSVNFSAFFEPADHPVDNATAVRAFYLDRMKSGGAPMENVVLSGDEKLAIMHYDMLGQRSVNAYLQHGQTWVDLHFSFDASDAAATKAIDAALASVKEQQ